MKVLVSATTSRPRPEPAARSTPTEDQSPDDDHDTKFSLSATQIVASTAAAVTAALIGSHLGVAGTLVGAAIASIVSGVGAAIYGHSLIVTRRGVRKAYLLVRPVQDAAGIADSTDALSAAGRHPHPAGRRGSRPRATTVTSRRSEAGRMCEPRGRRAGISPPTTPAPRP